MASPLTFALRVAAGLVSDTVDAVRRLPTELTTLPVTLMGRAAKLSFQLNQELTELAIRGDKLLGALHKSEEPPERTAWSTIDDEDEVAAKDPQAAARWEHTVTPLDDPGPRSADRIADPTDGNSASSHTASSHTPSSHTASSQTRRVSHGPAGAPPPKRAVRVRTVPAKPPTPVRLNGQESSSVDAVTRLDAFERRSGDSAAEFAATTDLAGLPGYDQLTLTALRTQVRTLSAADVRAVLEHEQQNRARPAFLTILTNRLTTLARNSV